MSELYRYEHKTKHHTERVYIIQWKNNLDEVKKLVSDVVGSEYIVQEWESFRYLVITRKTLKGNFVTQLNCVHGTYLMIVVFVDELYSFRAVSDIQFCNIDLEEITTNWKRKEN